MSEYTWIGRDRREYTLSSVTNQHLLFYFRQVQERCTASGGDTCSCDEIFAEVSARGLEPLPLRTPAERQAAKLRYQQAPAVDFEAERRALEELQRQRQQLEQIRTARAVEIARIHNLEIELRNQARERQQRRRKPREQFVAPLVPLLPETPEPYGTRKIYLEKKKEEK